MTSAPRPLRPAGWLVLAPLVFGAVRPDLYRIPLQGLGTYSRLTGTATLTPARSPFGVATTRDGHFVFKIEVQVPQLPPPNSFGAGLTTYVAWVTTAALDRVERLGPLTPGTATSGRVAMAKFLVVVTAEPNAGGTKWSGPIVMRGTSPSNYLANFSGHTMFNGGVPQ
jgi:hypothetical protein